MRKQTSGYTLLEILVVLVIISIVAGMAVLTIGHNERREMQAFARDLEQTLTLAEEQALLQPAMLGLMLTTQSFGFYEYRKKDTEFSWRPITDRELGPHPIPKGLELRLTINDHILPLESTEAKTPTLFVSTNGTITPFVLLIGKKNQPPCYQLVGHADGSITNEVYKG